MQNDAAFLGPALFDSPEAALIAERIAAEPIPVLQATRDALAAWQRLEDRVDAHVLADIILRDPLMTLRVLTHVSRQLSRRLATEVETVTAALVLIGIDPFFREFSALPTLEERLAGEPAALESALLAMDRANLAARLAAAIAIERVDDDVELIQQAALLVRFPEPLLWGEAPHAMTSFQEADLVALERWLAAQWRLPEPLRRAMHPPEAQQELPAATTVRLAVRIAAHTRPARDHEALHEDHAALGKWLGISAAAAARLAYSVD